MYDRSSMQRTASHSYPPPYAVPAPQKQYPNAQSTSSAFSASANPNEDWTKISDLAERRRIQNRIAQRNYRKKLKKRLEDLERRAGSSSASPEPTSEELSENASSSVNGKSDSSRRRSSTQDRREPSYDEVQQPYVLPSEDRGMFSQQYTRQLSTSPPPFSYASGPSADSTAYPTTYPPTTGYYGLSGNGSEVPMYHSQYLSTYQQQGPYPAGVQGGAPVKQEFYNDDEMSPFSMSYATMGGMDVSSAQSYHDVAAYVSNTRNRQRLPPYHPPQPAAPAAQAQANGGGSSGAGAARGVRSTAAPLPLPPPSTHHGQPQPPYPRSYGYAHQA